MTKWYFFIFFAIFLLAIPVGLAEIVGIGVSPTIVMMDLNDNIPAQDLRISLWNPSNTTINYTLTPNSNLNNFIISDCTSNYWCPSQFYIVNSSYNDSSNSIKVDILFTRKNISLNSTFNSTIIVTAIPMLNQTNGTVGIVPQVAIKIILNQLSQGIIPNTTTTTTGISGNNLTGSNLGFIFPNGTILYPNGTEATFNNTNSTIVNITILNTTNTTTIMTTKIITNNITVTPTPTSSGSGYFNIAVIIIVIFGFIVGGYFIYSNYL
jgi:hypothetical protein